MYKKISNLIKKVFQDYYEVAVAISASSIILLAIILDKFMYLQACPMCILTRYVFGLIAVSAIVGILFKSKLIGGLLMALSSLIGLFVSSRQIYIQNMSIEQIAELSGCGMPFHTQVEYFGLIDAINKLLQEDQVAQRMDGGLSLILQSGDLYSFRYSSSVLFLSIEKS
jgi:disulfide bond formation protein DsbB